MHPIYNTRSSKTSNGQNTAFFHSGYYKISRIHLRAILAMFLLCLAVIAGAQTAGRKAEKKFDSLRSSGESIGNMTLRYDPVSKELLGPKWHQMELNQKKMYTFSITGLDQVYAVEVRPVFSKRVSEQPEVLKGMLTFASASLYETRKPLVDDYRSKPYKIKRDYTTLKVSMVTAGEKDGHRDTLALEVEYFNNHYWKFDFTTGIFLNTTQDPTFYYADSTTVKKEKKALFDMALAGLFHFNYVMRSYFKPGMCMGAGISLFDLKPKYMLGLSLVVGRKNEFAFSGGLCGSNLAHVSSSVHSPGYTADIDKGPPTFDKWTWGYFFGISYSLFNN